MRSATPRCWPRAAATASMGPLPSPYSCSRRRSEEHTSELQSQSNLVCRLLLEKKKKKPPEAPAAQRYSKERWQPQRLRTAKRRSIQGRAEVNYTSAWLTTFSLVVHGVDLYTTR